MPIGTKRPNIPESTANSASQPIEPFLYFGKRLIRPLPRTKIVSLSTRHTYPASRLLSQDPWLVENEPARLERLKQLGEQAC